MSVIVAGNAPRLPEQGSPACRMCGFSGSVGGERELPRSSIRPDCRDPATRSILFPLVLFSACPARCAVALRRRSGRRLDGNAERPQERLIAVCQRQAGPIRSRHRRFGVRGRLLEIGPAGRFRKGCVYRQRNGVSGLLDVIEEALARMNSQTQPAQKLLEGCAYIHKPLLAAAEEQKVVYIADVEPRF